MKRIVKFLGIVFAAFVVFATASCTKQQIQEIKVAQMPNQATYYVGDEFYSRGLEIHTVYGSGKEFKVQGYTLSIEDGHVLTASDKTVTVTYKDLTTSFNLDIKDVVLESLTVINPNKTVYTDSENLNLSKMTVIANYNNDTHVNVTGYTTSIANGAKLKVTDIKVTVSYQGKSADVNLTVTHDPASPVTENLVQATCSAVGTYDEVVYCKGCGAELSRTKKTIEKVAHTWVKVNGKQPTCTSYGSLDYYECSVCHAYSKDNQGTIIENLSQWQGQEGKVAPTGHVFGEWTMTTLPTLTTTGTATRTCTVKDCTGSETVTVPALTNPIWLITNEVLPTHQEGGTISYRSQYGVVTVTIEKDSTHSWVHAEGLEPTCEADGYKDYYTCACGAASEDNKGTTLIADLATWKTTTGKIAAIGHNYGKWTIVTDPTLKTTGKATRICANCGKEDTFTLPVLTDSMYKVVEHVEPTHFKAGYTVYTCDYGTITTVLDIVATHTFVKVNGKEATCEVDGYKQYYVCGCGVYAEDEKGTTIIADIETWKITTGKIAAIGHKYGNYYMSKAPTLTEVGTLTRVCTNLGCGHEDSKDLAVLTDDTVWTVTKTVEATYVADGYKIYTSEYGEVTITIPAKLDEHIWVHADAQDPDCVRDGWKEYYTCACGLYAEDSEGKVTFTDIGVWKSKDGNGNIPALGHNYGKVTYTWAKDNSTVTAHRDCLREGCNHYEEETVATTPEVTQKQDCIKVELSKYTSAVFTNAAFEVQIKENVQTKDALGHDWEWIVDKKATKTETGLKHEECRRCHATQRVDTIIDLVECEHETLAETQAVAPTCEKAGTKQYFYCDLCDRYYEDEECLIRIMENIDTWKVVPALGHNFGTITYTWAADNLTVTARRECTREGCNHFEEETVAATPTITQAQSCENVELTKYTSTAFINPAFEAQIKENVQTKDALGHSYGKAIYEWAADNSTVTAHRDCIREGCNHYEEETVATTPTITQAQTCEDVELTTYTSAQFKNAAFAIQTKANVQTKDALGHSFGTVTYTWNADNSKVTAHRDCTREGCKHYEEEIVDVTPKVTQQQSCLNKELTTYTSAEFKNEAFAVQTKVDVETKDALGHDFVAQQGLAKTCTTDGYKTYYKCSRCDAYAEDEKGETPIADIAAWKVGAGKIAACHELKKVDGTPATAFAAGIKDTWVCDVCKKVYLDEAAATEVTDDSMKVDPIKSISVTETYGKKANDAVVVRGVVLGAMSNNDYCELIIKDLDNDNIICISSYDANMTTGSTNFLGGFVQGQVIAVNGKVMIDTAKIGGQRNKIRVSATSIEVSKQTASYKITPPKDTPVVTTTQELDEVLKGANSQYKYIKLYGPIYGYFTGTTMRFWLGANNNKDKLCTDAAGGSCLTAYGTSDASRARPLMSMTAVATNFNGTTINSLLGISDADVKDKYTSYTKYFTFYGDMYVMCVGGNIWSAHFLPLSVDDVVQHTHTWNYQDGLDKTCTTDGYKAYYACERCPLYAEDKDGKTTFTDLAAWKTGAGKIEASHEWGEWTHVEGTETHTRVCSVDGSHIETLGCEYNEGYCIYCNAKEPEVHVHSYTVKDKDAEGALVKAATCKAYGEYYYSCSCGEVSTTSGTWFDEVSGYGAHTPEIVKAKDATCTETGYSEHYKCTLCEKLFLDESALNEIELKDVTVSAKGHNTNNIIYQRVTKAEDLVDGDVFTLVAYADNKYYVASANTGNMNGIAVTLNKDLSLTPIENMKIFEYCATFTSNYYALYMTNGYGEGSYYAVGNTEGSVYKQSTTNYLATRLKFTFDANGLATNDFKGSATCKTLVYSVSGKKFCNAVKTTDNYIGFYVYKRVLNNATIAYTQNGTRQTIYKCATCGAYINNKLEGINVTETYNLVTDAATLDAYDTIIFVNSDNTKALGTGNNGKTTVDITGRITNNVLTDTTSLLKLTIKRGYQKDGFRYFRSNQYTIAALADKPTALTYTDANKYPYNSNQYGSFVAAVDANGLATLTATCSATGDNAKPYKLLGFDGSSFIELDKYESDTNKLRLYRLTYTISPVE